jgi:AbiV family abortive infection protein
VSRTKLNQYQGRLTPPQIAEGIIAATRNARRLADDAVLLLNNCRFASAASLAILYIEESGKTSILRQLSVAKSGLELSKCWRDYRSHIRKNALGSLFDLFARGARKLDEFRDLFSGNAEHPYLLDQLKQIGFYTDCLGAGIGRSLTR